ncbi:hypothetical protein [Schaalia cardiffensis]|uniref:hypothetical protein n=1 Tax=Schaalia cardiffensis TaxID=181487 RepID=UPI0003A00B21
MAKSRSGQVYPYFVCSHRQRHRDQCQFKAVLIDEVEARVTDIYRRITITPEERRTIEEHLHYELDRLHTAAHQHTKDITRQQGTLKAQQTKLLQAHYAGAIPLDLLKAEQTRITRELAAITEELHFLTSSHHAVKHHLTQALDLLQDCHRLYTRAPAPLKKLLNTIFFDHITVNPQDDDAPQPHRTAIPHPAPPFNHLTNPALIHATTTTVPASTHAKTPPANTEGAQNPIHFDPVSCKTLVVALGELDTKEVEPLIDLLRTAKREGWPGREQGDSVPPEATPAIARQQNYRQLTAEEKADIAQLCNEGVPVNNIAKAHRVTRVTVHRLSRAAGVRPRQRGLSPEQGLEAARRYRAGDSLATIAGHFNVHATTIRTCLLAQDVPLRPRPGMS